MILSRSAVILLKIWSFEIYLGKARPIPKIATVGTAIKAPRVYVISLKFFSKNPLI